MRASKVIAALFVIAGLLLPQTGPVAAQEAPLNSGRNAEVGQPVVLSNTVRTLGPGSGRTALAIDGSGIPVVAYALSGNLMVSRCSNAACDGAVTTRTVAAGGEYLSMQLDGIGRPVISHYAVGDLSVIHCGDTTCTAGNVIAFPDTAGDVGKFTSLQIDGAGNPVVSYNGEGNLKILRCGNADCASGNTITTIPNGLEAALALDTNGFPVVAYNSSRPGSPWPTTELRLLHCGDLACNGGNTDVLVRAGYGANPDILLRNDGRPTILHSASAGGFGRTALFVETCIDATCSSSTSTQIPGSDGLGISKDAGLGLDLANTPVILFGAPGVMRVFWDGFSHLVSEPTGDGASVRVRAAETIGAFVSDGQVKLVICGHVNCNGGNTVQDFNGGLATSLALRSNGLPVAAFGGSLYLCTDARCAGTASPAVQLPASDAIAVAVDSSDRPILARYASGDLGVVRCNDPACTTHTATFPDSAGDVGKHLSMQLDGSGFPVVSYYDATNTALKLLHCGSSDCSAGNSIVTVDSAGDVGHYTSLALDAGGRPIIAYQDAANKHLRVVRCLDPNCAGHEPFSIVDNAPDAGFQPSLVIDGNGNPAISYYASGRLRLARCGNPGCHGNNFTITLDASGNAGAMSALALDSQERPIVSYYDLAFRAHKLLACGNPTCTAGNELYTQQFSVTVGTFSDIVLKADKPVVTYSFGSDVSLPRGSSLLTCDQRSCGGSPAPATGGGASFGLTLGTAAGLSWVTGTGSNEYSVYRVALPSRTSGLLNPTPWPAIATTHNDPGPFPEDAYCYALLVNRSGFPQGVSDVSCRATDLEAGAAVPADFTLRMHETNAARLTWSAAPGTTSYFMLVQPMDGTAGTVAPLGAGARTFSHDTGGAVTCYVLFAEQGAVDSNTDGVCALPGVSSLTSLAAPSEHAALQGATAQLREEIAALREQGDN